MSQDNNLNLLPLEWWLKEKALQKNFFPQGRDNYFDNYWKIKTTLANDVYKWIGAGTSSEDQGVYTDHSLDHFNAVIKYAGELVGISSEDMAQKTIPDLKLNPYEVYILLVSILLHDAGNINGRLGHETEAEKIFIGLGKAVCPDNFEAKPIAKIAEAHGGKMKSGDKDTIRGKVREENTSYSSITFRPQLIAALVRFADEICEDRSRAARFMIQNGSLPDESKIFHGYANAITSVDVDLPSKLISIKYELEKQDAIITFSKKDKNDNVFQQYLIDEIFERLEKMYRELCYCRAFMQDVVLINKVRATVKIYGDEDEPLEQAFELKETGYPSTTFSFEASYPDWSGEKVKEKMEAGSA